LLDIRRLVSQRSMSNVPSQTRERLRLLAMILALVIGGLLIAQLWTQPLSQTSLTTAGRGVLFVLLALGLMGTRRLSVVLTALLCSVSLTDLLSVDHTLHISDALEVMTLLLCAGLLLVSARASLPQDTVP
jgi:peptidoglycan/LPS O-acetylase OafA/YrhL